MTERTAFLDHITATLQGIEAEGLTKRERLITGAVVEVLVEATSGGISPFTGTWTLGRGDAYASCFYVVTTFG